mmetsp:Transcript_3767/g.11234  ORF Transcript_3767/g.11234 Transcript_3767/m.11234 type:complete len:110 (-) Transcript_3767:80-409(-)|eukprot:CAMPEP_0198722708 /NCGR_PEP_ID=MMETSP1475-20131203/333_1 /TAXON_ID= ORGANISM="Unidentified sp., Strain CCMP1999" /NCGR_SAMPLE_ID=MMETSP1475 /ASSEMBLY_ACC=CAM_ASM_001111 /LENGTH=109 /DNA_ID=CAMNT_0044483623 /DNA_START=116 /DNA_END=445 /DNA_ORIENTATION=-
MSSSSVFDQYRDDPELRRPIYKGDKSKMQATVEELDAAEIPPVLRDYCAHLLIPLKKCRIENSYVPWACKHEKHIYEKCRFDIFQIQLRKIEEWREEKLRQAVEQVDNE